MNFQFLLLALFFSINAIGSNTSEEGEEKETLNESAFDKLAYELLGTTWDEIKADEKFLAKVLCLDVPNIIAIISAPNSHFSYMTAFIQGTVSIYGIMQDRTRVIKNPTIGRSILNKIHRLLNVGHFYADACMLFPTFITVTKEERQQYNHIFLIASSSFLGAKLILYAIELAYYRFHREKD